MTPGENFQSFKTCSRQDIEKPRFKPLNLERRRKQENQISPKNPQTYANNSGKDCHFYKNDCSFYTKSAQNAPSESTYQVNRHTHNIEWSKKRCEIKRNSVRLSIQFQYFMFIFISLFIQCQSKYSNWLSLCSFTICPYRIYHEPPLWQCI